MNSEKIDFILPWVDGNDPLWQEQKAKYGELDKGFTDASIARYRDWDNLQYWFRGVEKFAPWVNKIHFVTWGHLPKWLNKDHPKIHIVNHKDYIPEEYLPVFSCNPIELNLHRIPGLSDKFVYFNDDCFIIDFLEPKDFFKNGIPCDTGALSVPTNDNLIGASNKLLAMHYINKHFSKQDVIYGHFEKWFNIKNGRNIIRTLLLLPWGFIPDIFTAHGPNPYTKALFEEVWKAEPEILQKTCTHRFRSNEDVTQHFFKAWQICSGNFMPRKPLCRSYGLFSEKDIIKTQLLGQKIPVLSLNDENSNSSYESLKRELISWFEQIFPNKSSYEL